MENTSPELHGSATATCSPAMSWADRPGGKSRPRASKGNGCSCVRRRDRVGPAHQAGGSGFPGPVHDRHVVIGSGAGQLGAEDLDHLGVLRVGLVLGAVGTAKLEPVIFPEPLGHLGIRDRAEEGLLRLLRFGRDRGAAGGAGQLFSRMVGRVEDGWILRELLMPHAHRVGGHDATVASRKHLLLEVPPGVEAEGELVGVTPSPVPGSRRAAG